MVLPVLDILNCFVVVSETFVMVLKLSPTGVGNFPTSKRIDWMSPLCCTLRLMEQAAIL